MSVGALENGVSFVIPVFNKRPFLPQVIAGLKAQRGDFAREFIFIDDGSTDGSGETLRGFRRRRDARILRQANAGPSVATNRGLREARFAGEAGRWRRRAAARGDRAASRRARSPSRSPSWLMANPRPMATPRKRSRGSARRGRRAAAERIERALTPLLRECYLGPSNCLIRRDWRAPSPDATSASSSRIIHCCFASPQGQFVATDIPVVLHPAAPEDRLNDGGPQLLHDTNLTVVHFLAEHECRQSSRPWRCGGR